MSFFVLFGFDVDVVFADISHHHVVWLGTSLYTCCSLRMCWDVKIIILIHLFFLPKYSTTQEPSEMTFPNPSNTPYSPSNAPHNSYAALTEIELVEKLKTQRLLLPGTIDRFNTVAEKHLRILCRGGAMFTKRELEYWTGFYERLADDLITKAQEVEHCVAQKNQESD